MPPDNLLTTVLNAYHQNYLKPEEINQTFMSTISLLTSLKNPLNVTLLTSHLLISPAIWNQDDSLATSYRIISLFNTAALKICKDETHGYSQLFNTSKSKTAVALGSDDWVKAVIKGLDEKSSRWQHSLVLAGVLIGVVRQDNRGLAKGLKESVEYTMVKAINAALQQPASSGIVAASSIILSLTYTFSIIKDEIKRNFDYNGLLPIMIKAVTSMEGYQDWTFLATINSDLILLDEKKMDWSSKSASFIQLQKLSTKPLVVSMGPLSKLIAYAIENVKSPFKVIEVREHLLVFTSGLFDRWQRIKISEIYPSEESLFFTPETVEKTLPLLWKVFKTAMFTIIVVLRAMIGRTLVDPFLSSKQNPLITASQVLLMLKNMQFISSRLGSNQFSAYAFVNFSSIDILTHQPLSAMDFLRSIYPSNSGDIPSSALQRNNVLFYLNTAEHLIDCLGPDDAESLIIPVCTPYLLPQESTHFSEIFEAAHSIMLAIFTSPHISGLTARVLPSYVEKLLASFPSNLSPEQFRFAFRALIQICTPPHPLASSHPLMAETLLEVLHNRALKADASPLSVRATKSKKENQNINNHISEQSVLIFALLDSLPYVDLRIFEEWLELSADLLNRVSNKEIKENCQKHFWDILEKFEMGVEKGVVCVSWWSSKGGRERVLFNGMRGRAAATGNESKL